MGRNYDDPLLFLLDGVVDGCDDVAPSAELRALWSQWDADVATALRYWAAGHAVTEGIEEALSNEEYAYDVYQTLAGAGVGIDDGDWDGYVVDQAELEAERKIFRSNKSAARKLSNLRMHLERWLSKKFRKLEMYIQDTAMGQCEDEESEDSLSGVTDIRPNVRLVQRSGTTLVRVGATRQLPKWARPPR